MWWVLIAAIVLLFLFGTWGWTLLWLERRAHQRSRNALDIWRRHASVLTHELVKHDMKEQLAELRASHGPVAHVHASRHAPTEAEWVDLGRPKGAA